tara:strand:- start:282 stop:1490 length:1209 start_codon:yes stop_codon:yes gene_type:complete
MLGFFPAVIFADGGVGQKFHFWLFLKDRFFGGSPDPVWSEAGIMTTQEWLFFGLALPATLGAIYCLRRRPEFGAIQKNDDVEEREALEFGSGGSLLSMGGDAHTQAIVESVIGETQTVDENAVTAALGEMGAIAAANAAEEIPDDLDLDGEEPIMDSRFTTTIPDEESTEMVEAYIEDAPESEVLPEEEDDGGLEDDDIGWGVWDPEPESVSEPIVETPESAEEHDLPEIPELFREPIVSNDALIEEDPLATPSIPEIPEIVTLDEDKPNVSERLTSMATQAADVTLSATKEVVSATMTGAKEVASMAVGIKEKVVQKVRKQSTTAVMPVRPPELPSMAEWDPEKGAWTLMGRTVQIATVPEPEVAAPAWTQQEEAVTEVVQTESPMESSPRRKTPFIPELP